MPERIQCEFFLLRYVPDAVKNEFVNIGVMLREAGRIETTRVRFTRDWSRVRCMDPDADTALLEAMEGEIAGRVRDGGYASKPAMQLLEESLSTSVQITEVRGALAESMPAELEQLMRLYVEPMREKVSRKKSGRASIAASMRSEFERAGAWDLMRKRIAASQYTRAGDPLKLDCGYRSAALVRMFQAVSLEGDLEAAKVLAFSVDRLRVGVRKVEAAELDLAAIVEPLKLVAGDGGEAEDRYRFGVETMEEQGLRVLTVNDLSRVAETARRELLV
ncbi:DUF3037 domain-containing protein [Terriglobus sp. TAA 43]|uniref:DUF3037 domain-containing protein n=1 Tax=Terriglobus sp. TAA 43 TaxID=278961 RepID=UPI000647C7C4|nr:DUF3037 domain-containing protein [Terriglobus sp. TAA 43]